MDEFTIQNVVASVSLDQKIDLLAIMKVFGNVEYRPKQFPGLIYRMAGPKVVMLIFASGKTVITGGKTGEDVGEAVEKIRGLLRDNQLLYGY